MSATNPKKEPSLVLGGLQPQHLIYSVGLMDYLDDKYVIQVRRWESSIRSHDALHDLQLTIFCTGTIAKDQCNVMVSRMQIADWAYKLLRPGGKLILGNFAYESSNIVSAGQLPRMCILPAFRPADFGLPEGQFLFAKVLHDRMCHKLNASSFFNGTQGKIQHAVNLVTVQGHFISCGLFLTGNYAIALSRR